MGIHFTPPQDRMSLGQRLLAWWSETYKRLLTWFIHSDAGRLFYALAKSIGIVPDDPLQSVIDIISVLPTPQAQLISLILSTVTGKKVAPNSQQQIQDLNDLMRDPAGYIKKTIQYLESNPIIAGVEDTLGGLFVGTITFWLEELMDSGQFDAEKAMTHVEGQILTIIMSVHTIGLIGEITGVGQIKTIALMAGKIVDGIDLQHIMREIIKPVMWRGYYEFGRRYYNKRWRPQRWSVSELTQLYALRQISEADFYKSMQDEGYRDNDIATALRLSEKVVSPGDVLSAYSLGMIEASDAVARLHQNGYAPADIQFLIELENTQRHQSDLDSISASAYSAFKKHLISEAAFRQMRSAGRVPQDRIDLEVQLANLETTAAKRDLSVSNIKAAFDNNVIAEKEAFQYITNLGLDPASVQILIETWKEEKAPKVNRINSGTITQAYKLGLLTYNQGIDKLKSIGWTPADAELLMSIAQRQLPPEVPPPTENDVITAYNSELIAYNDAMLLLTQMGYSEAAATLQLKVSTIKPIQATKTLTAAEVATLLQLGYFDFNMAVAYLIGLGYDNQTAQLYLIAHTEKKPKPAPAKKA